MPAVEPGRCGEHWDDCPRLAAGDCFDFACAGCGDCCRQRRDLVLSGYDLYRIARRLSLPPRIVAAAFCKSYLAPESCLPALRLTPDPKTGNCRFFEGSACTIHAARPLACALYPLGQSIDTVTAQTEYYVQTPLCGARAGEVRTLQDYLQDSAVLDRAGVDARWAIVCTQLSQRLQAAGGTDNPRFSAAVRRMERALYYDYELGDDFYPQFCQNIEILMPLLDRMLKKRPLTVHLRAAYMRPLQRNNKSAVTFPATALLSLPISISR